MALSAFFPTWQPGAAAAAAAADHGLEESGQVESGPQQRGATSSGSSSRGAGSISHGGCLAGAPAPGCFQAEHVVLFEPQAFLCAGDMVRLMQYHQEDLVCGLQLDEHSPPQLHRHRRRHRHARRVQQQQQQHEHSNAAAAGPAAAGPAAVSATPTGPEAAGGPAAALDGPMAAAVAAASAAELQPEVPPEFALHSLRAEYDATREISGDMLSAHAPYITHGPSLALARAGLPVPVYCCWEGVVKLAAAALAGLRLAAAALAAGLRARAGEEGKCHPPHPLSLLCDDLWRTGRSHILLDPGVRTSSQLRIKSLFEHPRFPFFYFTHNWETTACFDIQPLLLLQYWEEGAVGGSTGASNASSSSNPVSPQDNALVASEAADDGTEAVAAAPSWTAADWQPGTQQVCCQGQQWAGAARPHHPTDCKRVSALGGKNFTAAFLQRCAAAAAIDCF